MRSRPAVALLCAVLLGAGAAAADAEPWVLTLDPDATEIRFRVGATLHTVRGRFELIEGAIRFDPETGDASGRIRVDATSGDTGIDRRDRNMRRDVLASQAHPEMVLDLTGIEVQKRSSDALAGVARGRLQLRGEAHELGLEFAGRRRDGRAVVEASFRVPYVAWGLPDPSTFLLRVEPVVHVEVTAEAALRPADHGG